MNLKSLISVVFSPIEAFERVNSEKPMLFDSLLWYIFLNGVLIVSSYFVFSMSGSYYGWSDFSSFIIGITPMIFLRNPSIGSFFASLIFGVIDVLLLAGVISVVSEKMGWKGYFPSLVMMLALVQAISILSVIALIPLQQAYRYGSSMFVLPVISIIFGVIIWKFALYYLAIKAVYKAKLETSFIILVASYVIYSIIAVYLFSFVFMDRSVITPLL